MTYTNPHTPPPDHEPSPGWGQALADGAAGLALLHIGYAHTGIGDWATAHQWVKAMTARPVAADRDASLFRGAPAVAFVLRTAGLPAYRRLLHDLDEHTVRIVRLRLAQAHERIEHNTLADLREFDLINGLTGLGVCLLHAHHANPTQSGDAPLREVLSYLVRLTQSISIGGTPLPGWWTPHGPRGRPDPRWPAGHANLGIAHGIAGPLALLSTTMIAGMTVPGQADAIERIDRFLDAWRCGPRHSPWWPGMISAREWANATVDQPGPQRPSWCYGTPGLTHARHLAAQALHHPAGIDAAQAALVACITDNAQLHQLGDDSLCHGRAGLVHSARRTLTDTDNAQVLADLERRWQQRNPKTIHSTTSANGLLEGHGGVALTHLPADIGWDACLLTSTSIQTPISASALVMKGTG